MYYDDNEHHSQESSSRERRRPPKKRKNDNEQQRNGKPSPVPESNLPSYRKKQNKRRKPRNAQDDDVPDPFDRRKPKKTASSPATRLPRSVSEEVLALEGRFHPEEYHTEANQRRARRHRERTDTDLGTDKPPAGRRNNQANKRRKKQRSVLIPSGDEDNYQGDVDGEISEVFQVDQEDLVDGNHVVNKSNGAVVTQPTFPSQPLDYLFIEKKDGQGFIREHRSNLMKDNEQKREHRFNMMNTTADKKTTLHFIMNFHKAFHRIAIVMHGLLAGIAVTQCIFVYILTLTDNLNLLRNYYRLASPFQSMYYLILAICCVSIFDRYLNVSSNWGQLFMRIFSKPRRFIATLAYIFALVLSVSIASIDDRISLYKELPKLWLSTDKINTWKIVNLMRAIGSVLGWLLVALEPEDDYTEETIRKAIKEEEDSRTHRELKALPSTGCNGYWD